MGRTVEVKKAVPKDVINAKGSGYPRGVLFGSCHVLAMVLDIIILPVMLPSPVAFQVTRVELVHTYRVVPDSQHSCPGALGVVREKKRDKKMMVLSQAPGGAVSASQYIPKPLLHRLNRRSQPPLFSTSRTRPSNKKAALTLCKPDDSPSPPPSATTKQAFTSSANPVTASPRVDVPLEGVIQFEKPASSSLSRLDKWGRVALLAGGDVLALLVFSAIGRFSHGFPVFDYDTLKTADPFIAGWFLGAYFLGGYGEDGRGMNGSSKAFIAAAKSWAVGIPLGVIIRAVSSGHLPAYPFVLVTMGSTAVLLIGWRALSSKILSSDETKKSDVYRRGNPFELFELLTSLVRRW